MLARYVVAACLRDTNSFLIVQDVDNKGEAITSLFLFTFGGISDE
jgi:hypothetical protein